MIDHNIGDMSESEEMYLISLARLAERGVEEPIPIPKLAEDLDIQPVSANQMVHKLVEEKLVAYLPYKGVLLTQAGREIAWRVLRDRRLWEVFLAEHLGLSLAEADALACRLEHITPDGLSCLLAKYLGYPTFTPQGLPIPALDGEPASVKTFPLTSLALGRQAEVIDIPAEGATRSFLETEGLEVGVQIIPLAKDDSGAMLVQVGDKRLHLVGVVAKTIQVKPS